MNPSSYNSARNSVPGDPSGDPSGGPGGDRHGGPSGGSSGGSSAETDGDLPSRRGPFAADSFDGAMAVFDARLGPPHTLMLERPALCAEPNPASGDETSHVGAGGRHWCLFREGQAALHARVPDRQAAWTRRLVVGTLSDAEDWRWLPAYVQRCANLVEIVLPRDSDRVVADLRTHGVRMPDGRWMLRIAQRDDGVGGLDLLCASLRRTLGGVVRRPEVLGAMGRPRLFERLARDVEAIRGVAAPDPALGDRIAALVRAIVDDDQIALRCALIAREPRTPTDRLAAMETLVAELRRAPLVLADPPFVRGHPLASSSAVVGLIDALSATRYRRQRFNDSCWFDNGRPVRPAWLSHAERRTGVEFLERLPGDAMTAAMHGVRDCALQVLRAATPFADIAFLSHVEEDVLVDALHLGLQLEWRAIGRAPGRNPALEPLPGDVREALTHLTAWVAEVPGMDALRRERWYMHLLGQAHRFNKLSRPVPGLLCGRPGQPDLDAPPIPPIAAMARSWGQALRLQVRWSGEPVTSAETVNRLLAERFSFGLGIPSAVLVNQRLPDALRWEDAERVAIQHTKQEFLGPDRDRRFQTISRGLEADLPNVVRYQPSFQGTDVYGQFDLLVSDVRFDRDTQLDEVGERLPGVLWNGRLRNRLRAQPAFLGWIHQLHALSDVSNAGPPPATLIAPLVSRVMADEAFAALGADLIGRQDGHCIDAHRRSLHQLVVLSDGGLAGDAGSAVLAAFQLACLLRADGAAQAADPDFRENLEDALLLRLAVAQGLRDRLGDAIQVPDDVSFGHHGRAGRAWNEASVRAVRRLRADAVIEAEIASGFATSFDCLDPDGLIGDLLTRRLDREIGDAAQEERLRAEAQARHEAASEQAGDDADAQQAADDRMAQDLDLLRVSIQARRQRYLDAAVRTLKDRLSATRPAELSPSST